MPKRFMYLRTIPMEELHTTSSPCPPILILSGFQLVRSARDRWVDFEFTKDLAPESNHFEGGLFKRYVCSTSLVVVALIWSPQCSDSRCHWTHYHTRESYYTTDGENLIARILSRELGVPVSEAVRDAPLRLISPLPSVNGPISCGSCHTNTGKNVAGARACIEHKCKKCCTQAFHDALSRKLPRDPCKAHKLSSINGRALTPVFLPSIGQISSAPAPSMPSAFAHPIPSGSTSTTTAALRQPENSQSPSASDADLSVTQPASIMEASTSSAVTPQPATFQSSTGMDPFITQSASASTSTTAPLQPASSQLSTGMGLLFTSATAPSQVQNPTSSQRTRPLKQPLGPLWLTAKRTADGEGEMVQDLKARRSQMDEELKRTIDIVIYFKVRSLLKMLSLSSYPS